MPTAHKQPRGRLGVQTVVLLTPHVMVRSKEARALFLGLLASQNGAEAVHSHHHCLLSGKTVHSLEERNVLTLERSALLPPLFADRQVQGHLSMKGRSLLLGPMLRIRKCAWTSMPHSGSAALSALATSMLGIRPNLPPAKVDLHCLRPLSEILEVYLDLPVAAHRQWVDSADRVHPSDRTL